MVFRLIKNSKSILILSLVSLTLFASSCNNSPDDLVSKNATPTNSENVTELATIVDTEDNYVAIIDNEKIKQSEFYFFLKIVKNEMESQAQNSGIDINNFWNTKLSDKDPKEIAKQNTLSRIQELKIQLILSKKEGFIVNEAQKAEAKSILDKSIAENGGEAGFNNRLLKDFGITYAQYLPIFNELTVISNYNKLKTDKVAVSDEEIKKYYTENKSSIDYVKVVHVLFSTVDAKSNTPLTKEKQDLAKKNADETLVKVKSGEDINKLAVSLSEDPGVTENGGTYLVKKDGQMVKEFEDWAFKNKVGDSGIVQTSFGYHVMKKISESSQEENLKQAKTIVQQNKSSEEIVKLTSDPKYKIVNNEKVYSQIKI